jgi:hypothetical protein
MTPESSWMTEMTSSISKQISIVMDFVNNCLIRVIKRIICRKYHEMLGKRIDNGSIAPCDTLRITLKDACNTVDAWKRQWRR